jgi:hypothetical protein
MVDCHVPVHKCAVPRGVYELHPDVSTLQGPELHLDMSALKRSVLLLEVSTVHYRGLSCIWTCLPTEVCTSPGGVCTTEVCV